MTDRSIVLRLRAEIGEFKKALGEGVLSLKSVETAAKTTGVAVEKSRSDMASAAKRAEAAEKTLERSQKAAAAASAALAKAEANLAQKRASSRKTAESVAKAEAEVKRRQDASAQATSKMEAADRRASAARERLKSTTDATTAAEQRHKTAIDAVASAQKSATTSTGRFMQAVADNPAGVQKTGGALLAIGTGITSIGIAAAKTGIEYNSLQQTSRAALKTMLGSAEGVNAQMAELDKFAKTSPFSKGTFITAQQQMLAFGIESKKVVPYLSAINDATAAAGGNSQQLGEVAFVMAQISAAGKITGQDLIQFGQRGINAAELIGSQMGKTGSQIREDITAGALGADQALDALAAGMSEEFAGASANVKDTFMGAMDRMGSAWRDFGAELASPLVNAEGGGILVDLANNAADLVREYEALPGPAKTATSVIVGTTAAAALLSGGLLVLAPRILATKVALDRLSASGSRVPGVMKAAGKAFGVAAAVFAAAGVANWASELGMSTPAIDDITGALGRLAAAGTTEDVTSAFANIDELFKGGSGLPQLTPTLIADIGGVSDALRVLADTDGWVLGQWSADLFVPTFKQARTSVEELDKALRASIDSGNPEAIVNAHEALTHWAGEAGLTMDQAGALLPQYTQGLKNAGEASSEAAAGTAELAIETAATAAEIEEANKRNQKSYEDFVNAFGGASAAFISIGGAYDSVIEKNKVFAQEQADAANATLAASGKSKDAVKDQQKTWEDYYDGVTVKGSDYIKALQDQVSSQADWQKNMVELSGKVSKETLADLAKLGPEGAPLVADLVNASKKELEKLDAATIAKYEMDGFVAEILETQGRLPELKIHASISGALSEVRLLELELRKVTGNHSFRIARGPGGTGGQTFAVGGEVSGPGTETSDSIAAWLSDGEHVWTAREVRAAGGHGAVEALRAMALRGIGAPAFAKGGGVGTLGAIQDPKQGVKDARARVKKEEREVKAAERAATVASRKAADTPGDKANKAAKDAAKKASRAAADKLKAERAQLAKAKKALAAAEKEYAIDKKARADLWESEREAAEAARDKKKRIHDGRVDIKTDIYRGDGPKDQVTGGLDNARRVIDDMWEQSRNKDLSKKQRAKLADAAREAEKSLKTLYGQADKLEGKLAEARDKVSELANIKAGVSSALAGEFKLGDTIKEATEGVEKFKQTASGAQGSWFEMVKGPGTARSVTSKDMIAGAKAKADKIGNFAKLLDKLASMGATGPLLSEIASLGSEEGTLVANALIAGGEVDIKALAAQYDRINYWSDAAGENVTKGYHDGGLAGAEAAAKGLADELAIVEGKIAGIGATLETTLLGALGLKLDAKGKVVAKALGGWVTGGTRGVDSVHMLAMPNEFVMREKPALANAALLEYMNSQDGPISVPLSTQYRQPAQLGQPVNVTVQVPDIYVTNPFTGAEVKAIVRTSAESVVSGHAATTARGY